MDAATPAPLAGGILGQVKSGSGVVQMGATVLLYNRFDQLVRQSLTNDQGKFVFDSLGPDLYSIRVTLASFVPAFRRNIAVAAGSESVLQINLANLLSSVDLVSSTARGTLMTDDWKWVLRSSQATRPVLRLLPAKSSSTQSTATMFSDTTGLVRVSAGDGDSFTTNGQSDLGTAFALATSIYGSTRVQFSGNLGYAASSGLPAGGFRASYSRAEGNGSGPEVTLTVRQLYLPNRSSGDSVSGSDGTPALRTASLALIDGIDLGDNLHLEYGASLESVSFLQRLNYVSPFARVTYKLDEKNSFRLGYSDGTDPSELIGRGSEQSDLNQNLTALSRMPRISRSDSQARMQRTQNLEAAYRRVQGSRTYTATVYHEAVSNAAFMLSGPADFVAASDTIADLGSHS